MIPLKRKNTEYAPDYPEDVLALQHTLRSAGYAASLWDIHWAWRQFSDAACAGWLMIGCYSHEERVSALFTYLEQDPDCDICE